MIKLIRNIDLFGKTYLLELHTYKDLHRIHVYCNNDLIASYKKWHDDSCGKFYFYSLPLSIRIAPTVKVNASLKEAKALFLNCVVDYAHT